MDDIILRVKDICKYYPGVKALDGVNFEVKRGEVHAICGENGAGKSTFIKILTGANEPTSGTIEFNGKEYAKLTPKQSMELGISVIYQEFSLIPYLSVAENIFYGREIKKGIIRDIAAMEKQAKELCKEMGVDIDVHKRVCDLGIAYQQIVEILKAVSKKSEFIIMDEPTSAITTKEVAVLFKKIAELKARGTSIIYISHKMEEIFQIADEITVFRDGKSVITKDVKDWTMDQVVECMVGRKIENQYPKENIPIGEEILKVENLSQPGIFNNVNFNVHAGEIIGFAGLMGAGRTEIMRAVFGLDPYSSGTITIKGKQVTIKNVRQAIKNGLAMLTEDRRRTGIVPILSVKYNTTLASMNKIIYRGRLHSDVENKISSDACKSMNVKTPNLDTKIANLSGGNQQKVILAKWLLCDPDILITDEPTRGIDVGAKREIYELMNTFAAKGKGIIMISSELPELIGICDRIYVVSEGRIAGMLSRSEFSQESIMQLAVSNMEHTEEVTSK